MPNFAVLNGVNQGKIAQIIVADNLQSADAIAGNLSVVELPDGVGITWVFDGAKFIEPTLEKGEQDA
jgi:hypothetical protein